MSTATAQPEPLQLAEWLDFWSQPTAKKAASELRRLHAENEQLRLDLEAVGAGGVGPLIPATVQHQGESSGDNELQRKTGDLITTAAPPQSGGIPPNWKMVPVEPNEAMHRAAVRTVVHCTGNDDFPPAVYRAMLAAAPQPPAPGCKATKRGDHVVCDDCKSAWDANDKNPPACVPAPPAVEQPHVGKEPDWKDLYQKEKRRAEMWIAKYEKDIGKLQVAVPVAARPPSVAARTCANCLHNKPPFGNCDGCSQQNDDADDEGNWEPIPEPQGEQEPAYLLRDLADDISVDALELIAAIRDAGLGDYSINMRLPARVCVAMCKRFADVGRRPVARVAGTGHLGGHFDWCVPGNQGVPRGTLLYTRPQPQREPLTPEQIMDAWREAEGTRHGFFPFARAIERATIQHGEAQSSSQAFHTINRITDIINLALEAGIKLEDEHVDEYSAFGDELERFAALVAAAEREACATIDVTPLNILASDGPGTAILKYRAAIRARGQS